MSEAVVTELVTYPIKSCAGINLEKAKITETGLEHDRRFMLVTEDNNYLSQRQVPELALVVPELDGEALKLSAPGMGKARLPLEFERDEGATVRTFLHGTSAYGQVIGGEVTDWLNEFLPPYNGQKGYKLIGAVKDEPRSIKLKYWQRDAPNRVAFADGYPILLASAQSLAALNAELEKPVPMNRFRPNVVVDGPDLEPYEEDFWLDIRVGKAAAAVVKACDRCTIPDVDQATAQTGKQVRRALRSRAGYNLYDEGNRGVFFGQNLVPLLEAVGVELSVGDPVEVRLRDEVRNIVLKDG